jgi:hypothetical protein
MLLQRQARLPGERCAQKRLLGEKKLLGHRAVRQNAGCSGSGSHRKRSRHQDASLRHEGAYLLLCTPQYSKSATAISGSFSSPMYQRANFASENVLSDYLGGKMRNLIALEQTRIAHRAAHPESKNLIFLCFWVCTWRAIRFCLQGT